MIALAAWLFGGGSEKETSGQNSWTAAPETQATQWGDLGASGDAGDGGAYASHALLNRRNRGACTVMKGNITVTVVFVDDSVSSWSNSEMAQYLVQLQAQAEKIQEAAAWRQVSLKLDFQQEHCSVSGDIGFTGSAQYLEPILRAVGRTLDSMEGPYVFALNKDGRAHAQNGAQEYLYLFADAGAFWHELNHLYGAVDFYYPKEVATNAALFLGDNIMLGTSETEVDDLTAYLIGWTDTPSPDAERFLEATKHITEESIRQALDENVITGMGTKEYVSGNVYTGYMVDGVPQGWGTMEFYDGSIYEGNFVNGEITGTGTLRWADGNTYTGDFQNGSPHGSGATTFYNGSYYTGEYQNGHFHGKGTLTFYDGSSYTGDFWEGEMTGYGTYCWSNGTYYVGEMYNGSPHGKGTMTFYTGQVQSGSWQNGQFMG